ncbi:MAG: CoB--CoM heterodisulfide reductase iron-sulfur subunit B family protein [Candidatus Helarchaeota archaeon]
MKYAYYLGCTVPSRVNQYDAAVRKSSERLGIELVDIEGAGCCGPANIKSINYKAWILLGARNIALAEKMGLDILALCNGCYSTMREVDHYLKNNQSLFKEINEILKEQNLQITGKIKIKQYVEALLDYGLEKIKKKFVKTCKGLKTAVHYGCHLLKPSTVSRLDNPESPKVVDQLTELTGAKSVEWAFKNKCCGAPVLAINENLALKMIYDKLVGAKKAGADCFVTVCPFCFIELDLIQLKAQEEFKEEFNIPVILLPQLFGLAMGIDEDALGLDLHRISTDNIVEYFK